MDQKEVYKHIRCWEYSNGESFLEYFGDNSTGIGVIPLMFWMYGREYITIDKLNTFLGNGQPETSFMSCTCAAGEEHAVFPYGECDDEAHKKMEMIIAELIAGNIIYEERLTKFIFEGEGWASFKSPGQKEKYEKFLREKISNWDKEDDIEYERILSLTISKINKRLDEEYKGQ